LTDLTDPDVSVADWIVVVLERDEAFRLMGRVLGERLPRYFPAYAVGAAGELIAMVNYHTIVEHSDVRFLRLLALRIPAG
jgi:hypothetical protein